MSWGVLAGRVAARQDPPYSVSPLWGRGTAARREPSMRIGPQTGLRPPLLQN